MLEHDHRLSHNLRNDLRQLHRSVHRESQRRYLAEGTHVCADLAASEQRADVVVLRDDASAEDRAIADALCAKGAELLFCSEKSMAMISTTNAPQSIVARVAFHEEKQPGDRLLLLDAVSDPGNVGTIIRCASWFGFSDVVLGEGCADLYNSKTIRSSAGASFRVNVIRHRKLPVLLDTLHGVTVVGTVPRGGQPPTILASVERLALVIGSEAHGISDEVLKRCSCNVSIPGVGDTESLNAAMAATILAYEARVQR